MAHIEVVLDADGNYLKGRSRILHGKDSSNLIPASESSAGRSGAKIAPHPLCEEIGYCAADYPEVKKEKVKAYMEQLENWANSDFSHPKLTAIWKYIKKEVIWSDLSGEFEFPLVVKNRDDKNLKIKNEKVFIIWSVEEPGNPVRKTSQDEGLINSWILYDREKNSKEGFCNILGMKSRVASNHPRFIRWPGDGAKLLSSNDSSGFTFRGRFTDNDGVQASEVGYEITQKAHNALRWLISRQGHRNGDQVYITWAVSGKDIPEPLEDSWTMLSEDIELQTKVEADSQDQVDHTVDVGESFANSFNKYLAGYRAALNPNEQIMVMGIDAATPGRMGILYYRELLASEFLDRIRDWHFQFAWPQRHTKEFPNPKAGKKPIKKTIWPISSPVPGLIAETAYGEIIKINKTLKKSLLERILPCIIDRQPFPLDVVIAAVRRTCNRNSCENWEFERNLGIACALYKGYYLRHPNKAERREYDMVLEKDRRTRDYLYGRLLAIADRIESTALNVADEKRTTTAARMMQRFADRPFSTWRNIELGLQPYMQRLHLSRAGFLTNSKKELDAVQALFLSPEAFTDDSPLSGEFLLGYHCQKQYWHNNKQNKDNQADEGNEHESK